MSSLQTRWAVRSHLRVSDVRVSSFACGPDHAAHFSIGILGEKRQHIVISHWFRIVGSLLTKALSVFASAIGVSTESGDVFAKRFPAASLSDDENFLGRAAPSSIIRSEKHSSKVNIISFTSLLGTEFSLARSCWVGMVSNNGESFCFVTSTREKTLSVRHVKVVLPLADRMIVPPNVPKENHPTTSRTSRCRALGCEPSLCWLTGRYRSVFG